jgi:phosphatidylserine/phosphatidylglycerophosphate/cardiolipin synthase-like enzyme
MNDFEIQGNKDGFSMKLWRGERMCLLGFDVAQPEPDFVGFAIECKSPGSDQFWPLRNRLAFSYDSSVAKAVTGERKFLSTEAPFQKFRWIHFPQNPGPGLYTYRATKMHMPEDGTLVTGTVLELQISLDPVTYLDFMDVGFTRNFASSQAYAEQFGNRPDVIPAVADDGLKFTKLPPAIYEWLGFEAYDLIFKFLKEAVDDPTIELDVFAYDLNEGDLVAQLEKLGQRLRVIIDNSTTKSKGVIGGHGVDGSAESMAAARLGLSAGADHVKRTHFSGLQHNKVFIAKRNGQPFQVLTGSTNFSFRGIYIQANNVLVFRSPEVAAFYGDVFNAAFQNPSAFKGSDLAAKWFTLAAQGQPPVQVSFAPHKSSDLSLIPVANAIDNATSSVLYSVAFLSQIKSGPTREAFDRLINKPLFSYGVVDGRGSLAVKKPDGSTGLVDFAYLAKNAPEPFKSEWSGGKGINVHHKFVVTDFNLPTARVFTGSSNLAPGGEEGNGDNLILIEDRRVATSYAIEALRMFDHLHFRSRMRDALKTKNKPTALQSLSLRKPTAISQQPAWFEQYYVAGSERERDRQLFSS